MNRVICSIKLEEYSKKESGINETTIHLNSAEYANSRFAGSQIVIREFSTAPLAYNIELIGTPQNAALFEQNVGSLMNAFQAGHHNFTVNRIDTRLASQRPDKPVFHRKETSSEKRSTFTDSRNSLGSVKSFCQFMS